MKALPLLSLCVATFVYLIPMQIALAQAVHTGYRGLGVVLAQLFFTLLFWISILVSWWSLFAQGGFSWLPAARPAQFAMMFGSWVSLAAVTALSIGLRGDPQVPTALRPLMPWAVYVLPAVALASTWALLLPRLSSVPQVLLAGRYGLGLCAVVALISAVGIAAEYTVLRKREMDRVQRRDPAAREAAIRRAVRDVESLDPQRDLARLLVHAGRDRFDEPRNLAVDRIQSHPSLGTALAGALASGRPHAALEYLEDNTPPGFEELAEPVRQAIVNLARWTRREISAKNNLHYGSFFRETDSALQVANKFVAMPGTGHLAAVRELRAAFENPKAKQANVDAIRLLDDWLRHRSAVETVKPSLTRLGAR